MPKGVTTNNIHNNTIFGPVDPFTEFIGKISNNCFKGANSMTSEQIFYIVYKWL